MSVMSWDFTERTKRRVPDKADAEASVIEKKRTALEGRESMRNRIEAAYWVGQDLSNTGDREVEGSEAR